MAGDKQRKEGAVLANGCVWRDPHVAPIYKPFKQIRIMSTKSYYCESLAMVDKIIADKQEIYSHVEIMGWSGD